MTSPEAMTVDEARAGASASSAAGAPWLIAFTLTLAVTTVLSFVLSVEATALVTVFQGVVGLPLAFALERRMGEGRMASDHPLRSLSIQMALVQTLALPAVIVVFDLRADLVPTAFAAIAGAHFLPYAWLHRTPVYLWLAGAVSIGSFVLTLLVDGERHQPVLAWWTACYAAAAVALLLAHRSRLPAGPGAGAGPPERGLRPPPAP